MWERSGIRILLLLLAFVLLFGPVIRFVLLLVWLTCRCLWLTGLHISFNCR